MGSSYLLSLRTLIFLCVCFLGRPSSQELPRDVCTFWNKEQWQWHLPCKNDISQKQNNESSSAISFPNFMDPESGTLQISQERSTLLLFLEVVRPYAVLWSLSCSSWKFSDLALSTGPCLTMHDVPPVGLGFESS